MKVKWLTQLLFGSRNVEGTHHLLLELLVERKLKSQELKQETRRICTAGLKHKFRGHLSISIIQLKTKAYNSRTLAWWWNPWCSYRKRPAISKIVSSRIVLKCKLSLLKALTKSFDSSTRSESLSLLSLALVRRTKSALESPKWSLSSRRTFSTSWKAQRLWPLPNSATSRSSRTLASAWELFLSIGSLKST